MAKKKSQMRLGDEEVARKVAEIRRFYNDYIVGYLKPPSVRNGFEERYYAALKAKIDLTAFLSAEREVVKELINREKRKKAEEYYEAARKEKKKNAKPDSKSDEEKQDFADKIIEQNRKKIEPYPSLQPKPVSEEENRVDRPGRMPASSFPSFSFEISKLYGALCSLCDTAWPDVERILRKLYPSMYSGPRMVLEGRVQTLCTKNMEGYPPALSRLAVLLGRIPRNIKEVEREEQKCVLEASFLLHDFRKELTKVTDTPDILAEDREMMDNAIAYARRIIDDFRLKDLKPD